MVLHSGGGCGFFAFRVRPAQVEKRNFTKRLQVDKRAPIPSTPRTDILYPFRIAKDSLQAGVKLSGGFLGRILGSFLECTSCAQLVGLPCAGDGGNPRIFFVRHSDVDKRRIMERGDGVHLSADGIVKAQEFGKELAEMTRVVEAYEYVKTQGDRGGNASNEFQVTETFNELSRVFQSSDQSGFGSNEQRRIDHEQFMKRFEVISQWRDGDVVLVGALEGPNIELANQAASSEELGRLGLPSYPTREGLEDAKRMGQYKEDPERLALSDWFDGKTNAALTNVLVLECWNRRWMLTSKALGEGNGLRHPPRQLTMRPHMTSRQVKG